MLKLRPRSMVSTQETQELIKALLEGDRFALSKALTIVESKRPELKKIGSEILNECIAHSGHSYRVAISGSPGVGKSTIINNLGMYALEIGKRPAILAIDPSSNMTKGSILGDKTRMEDLAKSEKAFIRPSPTSGTLGGVAKHTYESIVLCEAAGYDLIIIETVGVGQSETLAYDLTDMFILMVAPGAGDELQGIKKGIVELSDLIVVNKTEEATKTLSDATKDAYSSSVHLLPIKPSHWSCKTIQTSALNGVGIKDLWFTIDEYFVHTKNNNYLETKRKDQLSKWASYSMRDEFTALLSSENQINGLYQNILSDVNNGVIPPHQASSIFVDKLASLLKS